MGVRARRGSVFPDVAILRDFLPAVYFLGDVGGGIGAIEPPCSRCEGYGYVQVHSPSPPAFETCDLCGNPEGHPLP